MILISQRFFSKEVFLKGFYSLAFCMIKISAYSFLDSKNDEVGKVTIENITNDFICVNNYNYEFIVTIEELQSRFLKSCSFYEKYGWNLHYA